MRVGVVGATGQVGGVMRGRPRRAGLPRRRAPLLRLGPVGRAHAAVEGHARSPSRTPPPPTPTGLDLALFSAGEPRARRRSRRGSPPPGAIVIDNSSAWRMDPDVPLVVSEVNAARARDASRRASSPTRTARRWPPCRCSSRCTSRPGCATGREHLPGRFGRRARRRRRARRAGAQGRSTARRR